MRMPAVLMTLAAAFLPARNAPAAEPSDLDRYDALVRPEHRRHWAFQPVRAPEGPAVKNAAWVRNPIGACILAKLASRRWQPAPPAEPPPSLSPHEVHRTRPPPT